MADVKVQISEFKPCTFREAWRGECGKPSDNGWCTKHEQLVCVACEKHAVKTCDYTGSNPFVCGANLCADCHHEPYNPEETPYPQKHLKKGTYQKAVQRALKADKEHLRAQRAALAAKR